MRHDLIGEMSTVFGNMNEAERRAYSLGISHVYADVFAILMQVEGTFEGKGWGLSVARARLHDRWNEIIDIQTKLGVLP